MLGAGLQYQLSLAFPHNYPCSPPTIKFVTPCFHPNVDLHGNICLDILQVPTSPPSALDTLLHSEPGLGRNPVRSNTGVFPYELATRIMTSLSVLILESCPPFMRTATRTKSAAPV